jgi:hypothetical protein
MTRCRTVGSVTQSSEQALAEGNEMSEMEAVQGRMRPVYIGRRFVGEIPEQEWLAIVAEVASNRRIWEAQANNALRMATRVLGFAFISVPLGVFWAAIISGWLGRPVAWPGSGSHVGALMARPDLMLAGITLAVAGMIAIGLRLGYVNFFARARSALVKERLEIDTPGQCTVR